MNTSEKSLTQVTSKPLLPNMAASVPRLDKDIPLVKKYRQTIVGAWIIIDEFSVTFYTQEVMLLQTQ